MSNALEIKNLIKQYKSGKLALDGIDLTIADGDFYALLGINGAGKTTVIGIITDLVTKTSGTVKIFGHDIEDDFNYVKSLIGVVPQEFNFDMFGNCIDIVTTMGRFYGINYFDCKKKAIEILTILGLGDKLYTTSRSLSGGMKRRLMIARGLIHSPRFLILDEPTVGVDIELRKGMWEYLKEINKKDKVSILLTTHNLDEVEELCNRAAIIKDGKIAKEDTIQNLLATNTSTSYIIETNNNFIDSKNILHERFGSSISDITENTLQYNLDSKSNLDEIIIELSKLNIHISGLRPKSNRLEEVFLNIVKN